MAIRVVVTDDRFGSYDEENKVLSAIGVIVEVHDCQSQEETIDVSKDSNAILLNLLDFNKDVIRTLSECKVIARYGVGMDNVDIPAATEMGIQVTNVPDYCLDDVSDHALALLLACIRRITIKNTRVREGEWKIEHRYPSYRIRGKKLGLIGYGRIARTLHSKIKTWGLDEVLVCDPYIDEKTVRENGAVSADLATLLRRVDYVSIHAPLTDETRYIINRKTLKLMKPTAILVNTSRGPIVNQKDLAEALASSTISSAGIDVFDQEPVSSDNPLLEQENVVLSDHTAWYSEESISELKTKAAKNVLAVLQGKNPPYPVNNV